MMVPSWQRPVCETMRDCGCCGARGALVCLEPLDHGGVHAFLCRSCGKDRDCLS